MQWHALIEVCRKGRDGLCWNAGRRRNEASARGNRMTAALCLFTTRFTVMIGTAQNRVGKRPMQIVIGTGMGDWSEHKQQHGYHRQNTM